MAHLNTHSSGYWYFKDVLQSNYIGRAGATVSDGVDKELRKFSASEISTLRNRLHKERCY